MKLDDINLNNIKVVIFDFDDTLAIHKDKDFSKHRSESEENFVNFYLNAYSKKKKYLKSSMYLIKSLKIW